MNSQSEVDLLAVIKEIRNWIRAAAHRPVRSMLEEALPDEKSRRAYQMFDGNTSGTEIRKVCKMSPNAVVALTSRCVALGLMEIRDDKKRLRLFDLGEFDLLPED